MRLRAVLTLTLILTPAAVSARDVEACAALYRQLNNTPQIIGSTANVRRYAQELSDHNAAIRDVRIEMRRAGCPNGGGSIVSFGSSSSEVCGQLTTTLRAAEARRDAVNAEKNEARQLLRPSEKRVAILGAIRDNGCLPTDPKEQQERQRRVQGIGLPKEAPYSAITGLGIRPETATKEAAVQPPPPPPDRPYDPSRKVRNVGPVFLPETTSIDLANPRSTGPQRVD